jgi:flagellar biosynthesis/type III secretory pathway M-ring protein FliF/YscJ
MEFLRKLILQTKVHLQGLTVSQRLAIGSSVALIAVALFALTRWAAQPAMVPMLDQAISAQELAPIQQQLAASGVKYEMVGDVIYVPVDQRTKLLAQLTQQRVLPNDISIGFAKLVGEASNPWLPMQEQDRRWNLARSNELARVLREFNGVRDARVFIETATRRNIGQANAQPTASVYVRLADGVALDKELVRGIAGFVSAAVSNMSINNVTVADATTGHSATVPKSDDGMASALHDIRKQEEDRFASKIRKVLASIPVSVEVYCDLDAESSQEVQTVYGKPTPAEETTDNETSTMTSPNGEPGVVPNTNVGVAAGGPTNNTEKSKTIVKYNPAADEKRKETKKPAMTIKSVSASVNIPKSYLLSVLKPAKEPTDQELDTMSVSLRDKIKKQVLTAIPAGSDDRVSVDWFPDAGAVAMAQIGDMATSQGSVMSVVSNNWDKAGMGVLAVLGMLMMLMMVRKVGEGPVLPGEEPPIMSKKRAALPVAEVEEEVPVSEARESEPLLVGKEVDEETLRAQQIIQQVNELIKGDPASSAGILQRWIDEANG